MHKLGAFLVLLCLVLGLNHGQKDEPQEEEREKVPMDFLVFTGANEMEVFFGFEVVEYLHAERMRCDIKNRKAELKFTTQLDHMMRYFRQAKDTMSQPEFEQLASENKKDLDRNFQNAFRDLEVDHFKRLSRMHKNCDSILEEFMKDRMRRVMWYANSLLHSDMEKFLKFAHDMSEYQNNLQFGLSECIVYMETNSVEEHFEEAGVFFDLCYGNEVVLLLRFLRNFTVMAEDLMQEMLHVKPTDRIIMIDPSEPPVPQKPVPEEAPSDLEEGDVDDEGFTSGEEPEIETTPPVVETTMYEDDMDSTSSEEEWTTGKPEVTTEKTKPTKAKPTEKEKVTDMPKDDKKESSASEPPKSTEPKEKPTSTEEYPEWADKTFQKVGELAEKPKEGEKSKTENTKEVEPNESNMNKTPQRAKSKSKEESGPGLSIDLDLPGVDAGVDVLIGPNGVQIGTHEGGAENEIVFEEEVTTTQEPTEHHHGHSFKAMFFIYFFATLGVLLTITLVILIVLLVTLKMRQRNSRTAKDQPLLSEEEKIAVMKQSGYVNPTYQFFDQVEDV